MKIPVIIYNGGSFKLVNFGLFVSAGTLLGNSVAFFYLYTRGVRVADFCWELALILNLLNLVFAKLFYAFSVGILTYFRNFRHYFNETIFFNQGGMIGIIFGNIAASIFLDIPFVTLADAICLGSGLIMATGRIGCHYYGCCTGKPTTGPFSVIYSDPDSAVCRQNPAFSNTPLIPVQLIAALLDFMIFLISCTVAIHYPYSGLIMLIFIIFVNLKRIILQNFRQKLQSNKIPYKLVASAIILFALLIAWAFHEYGSTLLERQYPMVAFSLPDYFRFFVSDANIPASLMIIAVVNFLAYGVHGRRTGTHTNLVA